MNLENYWKLVLINCITIAVGIGILLLTKLFVKTDKQKRILFFILPLVTVTVHYSTIIYHIIIDGTAWPYLICNPNLLLPIYPCNVVMWSLLIVGIFWNKRDTRIMRIFIDFCFFFGIISALVGMFANVDFIFNPDGLGDYDIIKGVIAHGSIVVNVVGFGVYKEVKYDLHSNFAHLTVGVLAMGILGLYNNALVYAIAGEERMLQIDSMFWIASPMPDVPFIRYPIVVAIALPIYFGIFQIIDLCVYEKGNRWIHREKHW